MKPIFLAGTGTGVGKTLAAAILAQALSAHYWKPVQAGNLHYTDSMEVNQLTGDEVFVHPETYRLTKPASPHDAAETDNIRIEMANFKIPDNSGNSLIVEGAGGLMVPLNDEKLVIDLIHHLDASVVLVVPQYLGSINHTLLSLEVLHKRQIPVEGLIFNGDPYPEGENWILDYTQLPELGRLYPENSFDSSLVERYANEWHDKLKNLWN